MEKDAESFAGKEVWTKAKIRREDPVPLFDNSNSSSLNEMGNREVETEWNEKTKRKNSQGKDPTTSK